MAFVPTAIRVSVVGTGVVGEWLLGALDRHRPRLRDEYALALRVVAVANRGAHSVPRHVNPGAAGGVAEGSVGTL